MTPRSLLTAISATAIAFAIAIGIASGSVLDARSRQTSASVAAASASYGIRTMSSTISSLAGERLTASNDPCVIAL